MTESFTSQDNPPTGEDSAQSELQRQFDATKRRLATLVEKNRQLRSEMNTAARNNRRMVELLNTTRDEITTLKQALDLTAEPPFGYATVLEIHDKREPVEGVEIAAATQGGVDVIYNGRKLRTSLSPLVDRSNVTSGTEVLLDESLNIIAVLEAGQTGDLVRVKEVLESGLLVVIGRADDERVVRRAHRLTDQTIRVGDAVTVDFRSGYALDLVPMTEVQDVVLEEVPDVTFDDIGGLTEQIEQIRDAVESPFLHPDLYREHGLNPPKGILLYGPPGTGKTLIAKAVANSLARRSQSANRSSFFLNIKGPELLNKYVGETERHLRTIFARAREKAADGHPVVVFFDEMESLFRTRGSGVSSDVETTIVPQLLAEIDGVERLDNVIVIGASNREDMIDPAILRPGRLDVKIRVNRPDAEGAREILARYLTPDLPLHPDELAAHDGDRSDTAASLREAAVNALFAKTWATRYAELTFVTGEVRTLHFGDLVSGAVLANIVDRAKTAAIKEHLAARSSSGTAAAAKGLRSRHVLQAVSAEFREQEDLPNTSSPEEWARISGLGNMQVVKLRMLSQDLPASPHEATRAATR
ncbi:MAG: proteasome ATPase [Micrococcaceae bacterium]